MILRRTSSPKDVRRMLAAAGELKLEAQVFARGEWETDTGETVRPTADVELFGIGWTWTSAQVNGAVVRIRPMKEHTVDPGEFEIQITDRTL